MTSQQGMVQNAADDPLADGNDARKCNNAKKSGKTHQRPALEIYRPPGLRQNQELTVDQYQQPDNLGKLEVDGNHNCLNGFALSQSTVNVELKDVIAPGNVANHHVSFSDEKNIIINESQSSKPFKAAGSKQQLKKINRSHTSPLLGLVPNETSLDDTVISQHDTLLSSDDIHVKIDANGNKNVFHTTLNGISTASATISQASTVSVSAMKGNSPQHSFALNITRQQLAFAPTNRKAVGLPAATIPAVPPIATNRWQGSVRSEMNGGFAAQSNFGFLRQSGPSSKFGLLQIAEIKEHFVNLKLFEHMEGALDFMQGNFESAQLATQLGSSIVLAPIEHGKSSKLVAKLCCLLIECPTGRNFHDGLVTGCQQYLECAATLRQDHFRCWLNFVNFLSDLFASVGFIFEGELVQILFRCFDYMLKPPVLEGLKIEELESLMACMLNIGYDLERECPEELAELRNTLREAFIGAGEPWARKMILLMVELSACGWRLPAEANDYYFQTNQTNGNTPVTTALLLMKGNPTVTASST